MNSPNGLITLPATRSVDDIVARLTAMLYTRGVRLFALVDHGDEAERAGLSMPPTKLLIFGNPKAGAPLMLAAPSLAIDLPLKILVWQDGQGQVWISYNDPVYLAERHGLSEDLVRNMAIVSTLATEVAA